VRAPDHGRLGPWRFVVLEGDSRSRMAEALAGHLQRKRPDTSAAALDAERAKAQRAPLILVVAARPLRGHKVPEIEQILAVGAAVENLLLATQALGYGTMWKTGEAAYDAQVKTDLGLEPGDQVVGFIYIGTVAAAGQPRTASLEGLVQRL
jgi:nitroreductase